MGHTVFQLVHIKLKQFHLFHDKRHLLCSSRQAKHLITDHIIIGGSGSGNSCRRLFRCIKSSFVFGNSTHGKGIHVTLDQRRCMAAANGTDRSCITRYLLDFCRNSILIGFDSSGLIFPFCFIKSGACKNDVGQIAKSGGMLIKIGFDLLPPRGFLHLFLLGDKCRNQPQGFVDQRHKLFRLCFHRKIRFHVCFFDFLAAVINRFFQLIQRGFVLFGSLYAVRRIYDIFINFQLRFQRRL